MRRLRLLVSGLFVLLLLGSAATAAPALWKIEENGARVYLFGTIHLLKADTPWRDATLEEAFREAGTLVVEAAVDTVDPATLQATIRRIGYYPEGDSLAAHVEAPVFDRIMAESQKAGLPTEVVVRMRPWLVGLTLTSAIATAKGFLPQFGAEAELLEEARKRKMAILPLETVEEQFAVFAHLSDAAQTALITRGLDEIDDIEDLFEQMKSAWLAGDLTALDRILKDGLEDNPELAEAMLYARNRRWVPKIEALLETPGTYFVAVGTAHLVGEGSVIDLLGRAGHAVARQQ
ncbi:MAG: TraB/GumN family protein [Alphaproteobacteria bacterium]|nr:MAG: TraB/GumN family protein [Alphaproteobacteria bacterium]